MITHWISRNRLTRRFKRSSASLHLPRSIRLKSDYRYRVASTDYGVAAVLGPIMEIFATTAPALRVDVSPLVPGSFDGLKSGTIDLLLYASLNVEGDLLVQKLYDETYEVLFREGHPLQHLARSRAHLTPIDISPYRQIEFNFPGVTELHSDTIMRTDSGSSNAVFHQPYFTTLPFLIGSTDAVAAVPRRLADQVQKLRGSLLGTVSRGQELSLSSGAARAYATQLGYKLVCSAGFDCRQRSLITKVRRVQLRPPRFAEIFKISLSGSHAQDVLFGLLFDRRSTNYCDWVGSSLRIGAPFRRAGNAPVTGPYGKKSLGAPA